MNPGIQVYKQLVCNAHPSHAHQKTNTETVSVKEHFYGFRDHDNDQECAERALIMGIKEHFHGYSNHDYKVCAEHALITRSKSTCTRTVAWIKNAPGRQDVFRA